MDWTQWLGPSDGSGRYGEYISKLRELSPGCVITVPQRKLPTALEMLEDAHFVLLTVEQARAVTGSTFPEKTDKKAYLVRSMSLPGGGPALFRYVDPGILFVELLLTRPEQEAEIRRSAAVVMLESELHYLQGVMGIVTP